MNTENHDSRDSRDATVSYGPAPGDVLPADRAAAVLRLLAEQHPELLSALIGEAFTGRPPAARRQRAPQGG